MLVFLASLLFVIGAVNVLMGLLVLFRDYRHAQNQLFFLFSGSLGAWVIGIAGFMSSQGADAAFIWSKVYYFFPLLVAASMPFFAYAFPTQERTPLWLKLTTTAGLLALAVPLVAIPTFLTQDLAYHDWGKEIILNKTHYLFYSLYLVVLFIIGLAHIYIKSARLRRREREQARAFFWGFIFMSSFGLFFNLFLPWFGNYQLIAYGPIFTNAIIVSVGYSIVKHGLFDIRFFVLRAAAYSFTILTLSLLFIAPIVYVLLMFLGVQFEVGKFIIMVAVLSVVAFYYQSLRQQFNHITARTFFRDEYDSETVIAQLNRAVVSNLNINSMLDSASEIISQNLKADFCYFVIQSADGKARIFGKVKKPIGDHDLQIFNQDITGAESNIIITDYILGENTKLKQALRANDVAVIGRLVSSIYDNGPIQSYIVLGSKRGGNLYNTKDVRLLETVVDGLIVAIQNALHYEEIQNFNITLQSRITEATRKLRRTNAKLEALDETKDDFISMASHQLRTPLTSVKGYISMVLEGDAGKLTPLQRSMLSQAFVSSQRMVFLIADLLNISRLKTGKFVIEQAQVNLATLVDEEVKQLEATAKDRGLKLKYERPANFPTLMLDETKTRQVIMNFIDNAIYYTPEGGSITVSLEDRPDVIRLLVTDDGIGVPKSDQSHLFTKFYRAGNARRARPDGTGLGLFMAKKVIIAQGGALIFESQENKGSTFGFVLSKQKVAV